MANHDKPPSVEAAHRRDYATVVVRRDHHLIAVSTISMSVTGWSRRIVHLRAHVCRHWVRQMVPRAGYSESAPSIGAEDQSLIASHDDSGGNHAGVLRSTDGGLSWLPSGSGLPTFSARPPPVRLD